MMNMNEKGHSARTQYVFKKFYMGEYIGLKLSSVLRLSILIATVYDKMSQKGHGSRIAAIQQFQRITIISKPAPVIFFKFSSKVSVFITCLFSTGDIRALNGISSDEFFICLLLGNFFKTL